MLTITDHFSKYVKATPLPNQQAETVADAFVRGWIAVFGAPLMLHTDQGRNFDSAVVAEMCQLLDPRHKCVSPSWEWSHRAV